MKIIGDNIAVIEGDTTHAAWVMEHGDLVHDVWLTERLRVHLRGVKVVWDIGANIGTLTRFFLREGKQVVAVEANPDAFECLVHNCPEAENHLCAASDTLGKVRMIGNGANPGAMFCVPGDDAPALRLDDLGLAAPDFIKIDIEGYELRALRGAEESIMKARPAIFCEINNAALARQGHTRQQVFEWLWDRDYRFDVFQPGVDLDDPQYDILAKPKPKS